MAVFLKSTYNKGGKGAKQSLMLPKEATEYLIISGRSFSINISILLHKLVHLIK